MPSLSAQTLVLSLLLFGSSAGLAVRAGVPAVDADEPPDFVREVRPILSNTCFPCHGPDGEAREAELRLDRRADALALREGSAAIVPGQRADSLLWQRIHDADDPMPPRTSERRLSEAERALLGRWIDAGAPYDEHWSFVVPLSPPVPAVADEAWPRTALDRFVLARLEQEGLRPAPEADRETLARRLSFDLLGLPPTLDELDAFLADEAPDAYERFVERLFDSPHYAEERTRHWLDAARFADTHGFHIDNQRALHRWRDWVLDAFAANMPFDEFAVEQLAGDLLPEPTLEQRIATGFNRCNPTTGEGGLIEEEWLVRYAADRVDTTATVFLGLTMACAQCHDHKFDPITQDDYYRFFAFFHNLAESGSDGNALAPPPVVAAPTPAQARALAAIDADLQALEDELAAPDPELDREERAWEEALRARLASRWTTLDPRAASAANGTELQRLEDASLLARGPEPDAEVYTLEGAYAGGALSALRLEALLDPADSGRGVGRASHGNIVLSELTLEAAPLADGDAAWTPVPLAFAQATHAQARYGIELALDGDPATGWALGPREKEEHAARFAAAEPFGFAQGTRLRVRLAFESPHPRHALGRLRLSVASDPALCATRSSPWEVSEPYSAPSFQAAFDAAFAPEPRDPAAAPEPEAPSWSTLAEPVADGAAIRLRGDNTATYLRRTLTTATARALVVSLGSDDGVKLWLNGALVHANPALRPWAPDQDAVTLPLEAGANTLLAKVVNAAGGYAFSLRVLEESPDGLPLAVARLLEANVEARSAEDAARLREHFRAAHSPPWRARAAERDVLRAERAALEREVPLTMVSEERAERRPTYFLARGSYQNKGYAVTPNVPAFLPELAPRGEAERSAEEGAAGAVAPLHDRLDLARWIVSPANPLTARVTVNRFWQELFGRGLVFTSEDFGSQGAFPSHPELLDWLAVEFVEGGWDVRAFLRLVVTSATYRQRSAPTPALLERDPQNALFARGPSRRLDAEEVRDAALATSGLLSPTIGGPSVKPYQPEGLWIAVSYPSSNTARFQRDSGEALYRRSLYTFWKRTSPPPTMTLFDAPERESCSVRRSRTNTPLQALALLNEEGFVEAARTLAERVLREAPPDDRARARLAFRLATGRRAADAEVAVLLRVLEGALAELDAQPSAALELLAVGERPADPELDPLGVAAWTHVTNLLYNLDAFVTQR